VREGGLSREGCDVDIGRIMRVDAWCQGAAPKSAVVEVVGSGLRGPVGREGISCSP